MNTEPELLNERLERLAIALDEIMPQCALLVRDAVVLLKEQRAVEPTWQQGKAYCGSCGKRIPLKIGARFCHKCGQAVKWE